MRARGRFIAGIVLAAAAFATPAHAAQTQESVFMDDNLLLFRGDDVADATLRELKQLGVDRLRVSVPWVLFAPDASARKRGDYETSAFDHHDHLLRVADKLGIKVLFNITSGAPLYKPSPAQFARFVETLGARYDGRHSDENQGKSSLPRVEAWSIWNEPNTGAHLQPQWERAKTTRTWVPVAARIYRNLARAAIGALQKTGHGGDLILLGETAPLGLNDYGRTRSIRPGRFLKALLCLDARTLRALRGRAASQLGCSDYRRHGALAVTGYAHHPYSITSAPDVGDPNPNDIRLADAARLGTLLDAAAALHRIPAGLPYWWTEYGWQTNPPDPIRGVSFADQARWIAQAEQMTRADPRAVALTQFLLRDDVPRDEPGATLERRWGTYQTGLEDAAGNAKPAYDAYRLPLVATPNGASITLWGLVRPTDGQGSVQVQFAPNGSDAYQPVGGPVAVDRASRAFTVDVTPERSGSYRFAWTGPQPPAPPRSSLFSPPQAPPAPVFTSLVVPVTVG
ncbi:MAG TPA: hypothetical protein VFZ89_18145 [Solirubrobacteraceae bacterium]